MGAVGCVCLVDPSCRTFLAVSRSHAGEKRVASRLHALSPNCRSDFCHSLAVCRLFRYAFLLSHCDAVDIVPGYYVASCNDKGFGDYEHQAAYYDLNGFVRTLRAADVLFFGNSKVQYAFSRRIPSRSSPSAAPSSSWRRSAMGSSTADRNVLSRHQVRPQDRGRQRRPLLHGLGERTCSPYCRTSCRKSRGRDVQSGSPMVPRHHLPLDQRRSSPRSLSGESGHLAFGNHWGSGLCAASTTRKRWSQSSFGT